MKTKGCVNWYLIVGPSGTNLNQTPFDLVLNPKFLGIKDKALGSIPSIVFWNQEQLKALNKLETQSHILIQVLLKTSHISHTLTPLGWLYSFVKKLTDMGKEIIVLSAPDFEQKKNEEVLDIIFRQRYTHQTFYSIADLRKAAGVSGTERNIKLLICSTK